MNSATWAHFMFVYIGLIMPALQYWNDMNLYKELFDSQKVRKNIYIYSLLYNLVQIALFILVVAQFPNPLHTVGSDLSLALRIVCGLIVFRWLWMIVPNHANDESIVESIRSINKKLPKENSEKLLVVLLNITNGVSEEFLYRAFIIFYLTCVYPIMPFYFAILISAVIYSFQKLYYGWKRVLWELYYGLVIAGFYIVTGSIIPTVIISIYFKLAFKRPEYWTRIKAIKNVV